jgi:hypothetical protein
MRWKHYLQLLMVALFLFTYQKVTIHSNQHLVEEASECHLCDASEHMDLHHQNESPQLVINEHFAIKASKTEEIQIVHDAYDLTQNPQLRMVDFDGLVTIPCDTPSLGYYSTAPPFIFS